MQHQIHPDDERLAALAGGDPDIVADADLRAHVSACDRCRDVLNELATLRAALAELPDLVPSRQLQLIPPVAEPRAASSGSWLRRLAAPVMAAGFGLVLVGAIGTSGVINQLSGLSSGAAPMLESVGQNLEAPLDAAGAPTPESSVARELTGSQSHAVRSQSSQDDAGAASPSDAGGEAAPPADTGRTLLFRDTDQRLPWLIVLGLGVGVLIAGIYLRFSAQPRS